ncbi:MAG: DNA photolyase family protein [bacterium]|nr:DNA photolyase family protein [bacterium]
MSTTLFWFRNDLRLADNPALTIASETAGAMQPVFLWCPLDEEKWAPGAASRWWLHHSLASLTASLREKSSTLLLRQGITYRDEIQKLFRETKATRIVWCDRIEPAWRRIDNEVATLCNELKVEVIRVAPNLLCNYQTHLTKTGKPYQVYTPFWNAFHAQFASSMLAQAALPRTLPMPVEDVFSLPLDALELLPTVDWASGFPAVWRPGEQGAQENLARFLANAIFCYDDERDYPAIAGTSRLSPHLHFGELSIHRIWRECETLLNDLPLETATSLPPHKVASSAPRGNIVQYQKELVWREFAHYLLWHFPHTSDAPLREKYARFPWRSAPEDLRQWQRGCTGYPLVDAGMRELWATGWMHNRVRMITASFLVKDLLVDWRTGAEWFWDTLVDADLANNTLGWQWTAGCGADAAPFFRIFNPTTQAEKFDPTGAYRNQWQPRESFAPMIDHKWARERALAALQSA